MRHLIHRIILIWISLLIASSATHGQQNISTSSFSKTSIVERALTKKESLGKKLFFDKNLSTPIGQSCADCHAPETGFANPNPDYPVSQGVHKDRFGNRNDLPSAYAAFSPTFHYDPNEELYVGGQFWDGRAADLAEQAKGPFVNALEMANPDEKTVVDKVSKSEYADIFREVFGAGAFDDPNKAYDLIANAIAEYERSSEVNQFSSKYDLYLAGNVDLTEQEQRGLGLFEDINKGKCAECHPSRPSDDGTPPLFTDFTYDNLGAPQNPENPFYYLPKELNPDGVYFIGLGLGGELNKPSENGKFKVPSLRNIARTAPYLHNGIFKNLRQVVVFYNTRDVGPWAPPEVRANVNREELGDLGLTEQEVDDIVAFLQTLTDGYNSSEK
jgi:cytochrome c peroxidase